MKHKFRERTREQRFSTKTAERPRDHLMLSVVQYEGVDSATGNTEGGGGGGGIPVSAQWSGSSLGSAMRCYDDVDEAHSDFQPRWAKN